MPDLPITVVRQEKSNWCYSAVSQAVLAYYGVARAQADIAKWSTENDPETMRKRPVDYNCPQDPVHILDKYGVFDRVARRGEANVGFILDAINAKRPVIALVNQGPIDHYVLIKGYDETRGATARRTIINLHILDPYNPETPTIVNALDFLQGSDFRGLLFTKDPRKRGGRSRKPKRRRTKRRHTLRMNSHPK